MIQVWKYDENKIFSESIFIDEVIESMTTVPLLVGYIKPKFNDIEWIEGATPQEIIEWEEANKSKPSEPTDVEKISILEEEILMILEQNVDLEYRLLILEFNKI